jgi:hypothetical protein
MKKCPRCAEEVKEEAVVCRFCGYNFLEQKSAKRVLCDDGTCTGTIDEKGICNVCGKQNCPRCAEEVKEDAVVCRFCGYNFLNQKSIERLLCSDGTCTGTINEKGVCNVCGKQGFYKKNEVKQASDFLEVQSPVQRHEARQDVEIPGVDEKVVHELQTDEFVDTVRDGAKVITGSFENLAPTFKLTADELEQLKQKANETAEESKKIPGSSLELLRKIEGELKRNVTYIQDTVSPHPCPYCHTTLEKAPLRKKKCPACNNYIYVRTLPHTKQRVLATDIASDIIEEYLEYHVSEDVDTEKWMKKLGIDRKEFEEQRVLLSKKFGSTASDQDTLWSIFNKSVLSKPNDFSYLKGLYYEMALFKNEIGKNPFNCLKQSARFDLLGYKKTPDGVIKGVEILTSSDSCEACSPLKGKFYTINEALKEMPIPNKNCVFCDHGLRNFCRCEYLPVLTEE